MGGSSPNSDYFLFLEILCFFVFFVAVHVAKKMLKLERVVGG